VKDGARLVILDCDGVMFDSFEANVAFYDAVLAALGLPPLDEAGREHAHRLATPQILEWLFASEPERLAEGLRLAKQIDYRPFLPRLRPVDDLFETLAWLRSRYRTAMATNRGGTIPLLVEHFELASWFDVVVGIHDVPRPKPAPDMLLHCLERLGVAASAAVYVGDSPSDLAAAEAAGIEFVAVGESVQHPARIAELRELPVLLAGADEFTLSR
jgi:HAD superfamily hydrolase (TIGR01509 family)